MSHITVIGSVKPSTKIESNTHKQSQVPMIKIKARGEVKKPTK